MNKILNFLKMAVQLVVELFARPFLNLPKLPHMGLAKAFWTLFDCAMRIVFIASFFVAVSPTLLVVAVAMLIIDLVIYAAVLAYSLYIDAIMDKVLKSAAHGMAGGA